MASYAGLEPDSFLKKWLLLGPIPVSQGERSPDPAAQKKAFESDSPGAAVLIAKDGKIVLKKSYGYANLGHRAPITAETKFRIGSISKQFTAAAILKLQEQGKVSVDDKLTKFISDYPRGDEVTIHHLLTHTSGIHSYTSNPDFFETVTVPIKPEELIKGFKSDPYDFSPGEKWQGNSQTSGPDHRSSET